jgi:hypothetical protein
MRLSSPLPVSLTLATLLLAAEASAQRTWVVDSLNRPGTDFTDLPAAVAAASARDTLWLRGGTAAYTATTISKGLTLLGEDTSVGVAGTLMLSGLPASEGLVLSRLALAGSLVCTSAQGHVVLEEIRGGAIQVDSCQHVSLNRCSFNTQISALRVTNSTVVAQSSRFESAASTTGPHGVPAAEASNARVTLVGSQVLGPSGWSVSMAGRCFVIQPAGVGMRATDSRIVLGGFGTTLQGGPDFGCLGTAASGLSMTGGHLFMDPSARIVRAVSGTGYQQTLAVVPSQLTTGAAPGALLQARFQAFPGAPVALFASLPVATPLRLPPGDLWLDPATLLYLAAEPNFVGLWSVSLPVPLSVPRGLALAFQSVQITGSGATLSTPATSVMH